MKTTTALVAAALVMLCMAGIVCANENATLVRFEGKGVLTLEQELGGYKVIDKYVVDKAHAEAIVRFENGTEYNITAGSVLRRKNYAYEGDSVEIIPIKHNASSTRKANPHRVSVRVIVNRHNETVEAPDGLNVPELDYPRVALRQYVPVAETAKA